MLTGICARIVAGGGVRKPRSDGELLRLLESAADDFDQLALNVGYFVLLWAAAEQWLDMCVAVLYRGFNREPGGRKKMPKNLQPRLEFLTACFEEMPLLAQLRTRGLRVVAGFARLSSTRHELIHGAIRDAFITGTRFKFYKFELSADGQIHETRTFTFELSKQAPKLHGQIQLLEQRTMDLFYRLHDLWRRQLLEEAGAKSKDTSAPKFVELAPDRILTRKGKTSN